MALALKSYVALSALLSSAVVRAGSAADPNLAKQPIDVKMQYGGNLTEGAIANQKGWENSKLCIEEFCIFANKNIAGGRGIAIVTTTPEIENIRPAIDKVAAPGHFEPDGFKVQQVEGKGGVYVATEDLKRARPLLRLLPVLIVNRHLFNETTTEEWTKLLEGAVALLPEATRAKFDAQRTDRATGQKRNIKDIIYSNPFQVKPDTKSALESEWHYLNYPEMDALAHDCRPSTSWHNERDYSLQVTAARKMVAGDMLTISHIDHTMSRAERAEASKLMMHKACTCDSCTGAGGDLMKLVRSDARIEEITTMTSQLEDIYSKEVDRHYVNKYIKLVTKENLQAYLHEYYWRAAINYNYLGFDEQAIKFAHKAVQAAVIQWGKEADPVVEMRIFLQDPLGHYSWKRRLTLREQK